MQELELRHAYASSMEFENHVVSSLFIVLSAQQQGKCLLIGLFQIAAWNTIGTCVCVTAPHRWMSPDTSN